MPNIRFYAPNGVNYVSLPDEHLYPVIDGYITADSKYAVELLKAGFTPGTEKSVTLDKDNILVANVVPRTGTLAALLTAVTDAGIGEIASATDVDALVKYHAPNAGKAYYRSTKFGSATMRRSTSQTAIPTGTDTKLTLNTAFVDPQAVCNAANNQINIPADVTHVKVTAMVTWPGGSGTYRKLTLGSDGTPLTSYMPPHLMAPQHASQNFHQIVSYPKVPWINTGAPATLFLSAAHDLGVDGVVSNSMLMVEMFKE